MKTHDIIKKYIILNLVWLPNLIMYAQSIEIGGSIIVPPSPTASSIVNQIEQNVQHYTGALQLGVPIYTLRSRSLSVPVNLSYNGSGVKVNDIASWVGLGWSLNAGGVISRVMNGLPDEFDGNVHLRQQTLPGKGWLNPVVRGNSGLDILDYFSSTSNNQRANLIEFSNKTGALAYGGISSPEAWDTEPDEFYFNFNGYSGKFIFDKSGEIRIIPAQNLKVTRTITPKNTLGGGSQEITSFEITDGNGIVYTFGNTQVSSMADLTAVERTTHSYFMQNILCGRLRVSDAGNNPESINASGIMPQPTLIYKWGLKPIVIVDIYGPNVEWAHIENMMAFTSTWHLTRITTPNEDDFISFSYVPENINYMNSHTVDVVQENLDFYQDHRFNKIYFGTLKAFTSLNGKIVDEPGLFTTRNGTYNLGYRYLPQSTIITTSYNNISSKRLNEITTAAGNRAEFIANSGRYDLEGARRLDQINIYNTENMLVKTTTFDYDFSVDSFAEDPYFDDLSYWYWFDTSNSILKITEYGFDQNTSASANSFRVYHNNWYNKWRVMVQHDYWRMFLRKITDSYGSGRGIETYRFDYNFGNIDANGNYDNVLPRRLSYQQDYWGYYNSNTVGHTLSKLNYNTWWGEYFGVSGFVKDGLFAQRQINLGPSFRQTHNLNSNGAPIDPDPEFNMANRGPNLTKAQAGTLTEVIFPTGAKKKFTYQLNRNSSGNNVGGLRILYIDDYPDKELEYFERTTYEYFDGRPAISGFQFKDAEVWDQDPTDFDNLRNNLTISSLPMNHIPTTKGGWLGYGRVKESRAERGSTLYFYKNAATNSNTESISKIANNNNCSFCPAYSPTTDMDHMRGLLEKVEIANSGGKVLQRTTYIHSLNPQGFSPVTTYAMKPGVRFQLNNGANPIDPRLQFGEFYGYRYDWVSLASRADEVFDQSDPGNESKKIVTTTHYTYTRPDQTAVVSDLIPRKITTVLANGENLVSETQYSSDYSILENSADETANGIFLLKQKKMDNVPVESIQYLERQEDGQTKRYYLGAKLIKYKEFVAQSGKVYPWQEYHLKSGTGILFSNHSWSSVNGSSFNWPTASSHKLLGTINNYDNFGNPTSLTEADGITTNYTWGHNNSLLISTVQNAGDYQHQTSYQHKPLVGVTRITDPNSRNSHFTYDHFSRLKLIKDHDEQILTRYRYYYKDGDDNGAAFKVEPYGNETFRFTSTGNNEPGSQYTWNFGNGTVKENGQPVELANYPVSGQYQVSLTVTHPEFAPSTATKTITVLEPFTVQITSPVTGANRTVSCGNNATTICQASVTNSQYNYQWQYNYSASGSGAWVNIGTNSPTLTFSLVGANGSSNAIRCVITDVYGNSRYSSNNILIWYTCGSGGGGPNDCPPGWTWNAQMGRCDPPQGYCGEGCVWSGTECVCY